LTVPEPARYGEIALKAGVISVPQTLDDLAAMSGVSRATVSRVINGGPVSEATRNRVLEVVRRTRYRPNVAARRLASGRSGLVGVVLHHRPALLFQDPYFGALLEGMTDTLSDQAAGMMLWLGNRTKEETLDEILKIGLLDGAIVTANTLDDPLVDGLIASDMPTVLVGHRRADLSASYVDVDHVAAADTMTSHLVDIGRRRVGHITGRRGTVTGEDRLTGYLQAMHRAGLPIDGLVENGDFTVESGVAAATTLLDRNVDALFCGSDLTAKGALRVIASRGLRVPEDVAVAGYDNLALAATLDPPLTTVDQGVEAQGSAAARTLFELVADTDRRPRRVILPTKLVIRESTRRGGPAR
jgi:DNA-binding LacI/PurR family transcriptional regulator